jgi:mono/diheme cytochrome c family protein
VVSILVVLVGQLVLAHGRHRDASSGARTFEIYCSKCHVPGSREAVGSDLHHIVAHGHLRESEVRKIIIDGRNTMPPFGRRLDKEQIQQLIQYLKQL